MVNRDVFPPYNLPDEVIPWGREVQKRVIAGENSEVQLTQKVDNGLRATAGQLSALADQIVELSEGRITRVNSPADTSVTYNATSGPHLIATVPAPVQSPRGGTRSAIVSFTFGATKTEGSNVGFSLWTEVLYKGSTIWRAPAALMVGAGGSYPPGWEDSVYNGSAFLNVSDSGGVEDFAFRFWSYDFQADSGRQVLFRNMTLAVSYQDLVQ